MAPGILGNPNMRSTNLVGKLFGKLVSYQAAAVEMEVRGSQLGSLDQ